MRPRTQRRGAGRRAENAVRQCLDRLGRRRGLCRGLPGGWKSHCWRCRRPGQSALPGSAKPGSRRDFAFLPCSAMSASWRKSSGVSPGRHGTDVTLAVGRRSGHMRLRPGRSRRRCAARPRPRIVGRRRLSRQRTHRPAAWRPLRVESEPGRLRLCWAEWDRLGCAALVRGWSPPTPRTPTRFAASSRGRWAGHRDVSALAAPPPWGPVWAPRPGPPPGPAPGASPPPRPRPSRGPPAGPAEGLESRPAAPVVEPGLGRHRFICAAGRPQCQALRAYERKLLERNGLPNMWR